MNQSISHLTGVDISQICTDRLTTQVLASGPPAGEPVLFLHGNLSGATFWEETMLALPDGYRGLAPDQRGFGRSDPAALIDATRGVADWADDAIALADRFGWDRFHLVGHSLGGCIAWRMLGFHSPRLLSVTLVAPGPPNGFPGGHGERGRPNHEDGAGSGAALVNSRLVGRLQSGEREVSDEMFSPRAVMNRAYWKPPFRPPREEALLSAMLQVHLGEKQFPGDWTTSPHWPGFAPGRYGPINALSPRYNQGILEAVVAVPDKPPLLCVSGRDDVIISDQSLSDPGQQGQLQLRPGWPGASVFPPQPLSMEVKYALDQYEEHGGAVDWEVFPGVGHTPYLERPLLFQSTLHKHLRSS